MELAGALSFTCCIPVRKIGRRFWTISARKEEFQDNSKNQRQSSFPIRVSKSIIARAAIGLFGLGFIDAGYSGDWSRIGVITPQSEELLKIAAFVVVPLCVFLIFSLSNEPTS
ncbi:hypothetical protein VNO77_24073 [Canavalia gladiata]|uniref:DUF7887 domain-containing protein n=1 Tax=Canavalia gladiata TaxID=3824 RepID=A0AAN9L5K2_CANGL